MSVTHNILVPVDGSDSAQRALTYAAEQAAGKPDVFLRVMYVHPRVELYGEVQVYVGEEKMRELVQKHDQSILRDAESCLASFAVKYSTEALQGDPAELIAARAHELGCDSIVMGTRGLGRVGSLVMGSVAIKVVHLTPLPVTLVK